MKRLLDLLLPNCRKEDEIVVLWDVHDVPTCQEGDVLEHFREYFGYYDQIFENFHVHRDNFVEDFADWKNKLTDLCIGYGADYIFQLDADETVQKEAIQKLPEFLETARADLYVLARENIVTGITPEAIIAWGWKKDDLDRINWPDPQGRIYRASPKIRWSGKVHEVLTGYRTYSFLRPETIHLIHVKSFEKQIKQNEHYTNIFHNAIRSDSRSRREEQPEVDTTLPVGTGE